MKIIPAIDIIDGKCVRLTQGDYAQKIIYNENPVEVAKNFEGSGLQFVHLVDLDGAKAGKVVNWKVVESVCQETKLNVDFGGGIKTDKQIQQLFDCGVKQVNLGSIAVRDPQKVTEWISRFGAEKIILSADVKDEMIAIDGWQENAAIPLNRFLSDYIQKGIKYVTCTDINVDGMLTGPSIELYKKILITFPSLSLIASGGVSSLDDIQELKRIGVDGVIVGKAIYEGRFKLEELVRVNS